MLQREVAERVAAAPGEMSYLSVFVQYHAKARIAFRVPREAFEPAPKVESAVLVLEPYPADDRLDADAEDHLWRVVQAGFRERRKMLHNVLTRQLPFAPDQVDAALETRRHRARPPAADRRGGGVDRARRGARPDPGGLVTARRDGPVTLPAAGADRRLAPVIRLAPAKVNLTLAVLGTRPDGFHDLHSVMVPLDLADRLSLSVLAARAGRQPPRRRASTPGPPPTTSSCARSPSRVGTPPRPWVRRGRCRRSPRAWTSGSPSRPGSRADRPTPRRPPMRRSRPGASTSTTATRHRIAAELGSDVPFFLAGGPALVEGRGERVTPLGWLRDAPTRRAIARACWS